MCYYLYGAVNEGVRPEDFEKVMKHSGLYFSVGGKDEVNRSVRLCSDDYRITREYCDCGTPIGDGHPNKKGLSKYVNTLKALRNAHGIKWVLISKNWVGEENEREETVHIDDVDLPYFLANMEENCLYRVDLYRKYY